MFIKKLVKKLLPKGIFYKIEPYGHLVEAFLVNLINGFPGRNIKVIGVTGTNGKTTTSFMIYKMLQTAGYKTGLMTTVAWGAGDDIKSQIHHYTNVPSRELMKRLKYMKDQKVDWLVLETTSQALAQHRVFGIKYSIAVFTNLTHEHLDYHRTFERYRDAKRRMFKSANKNKNGLRTGIINADDNNASFFAKDVIHPLLYGINNGEIKALNIKQTARGSSYLAKIKDKTYNIQCALPGSFNIYNSLAVVGVGYILGLNVKQVEQGIASLKSVEGRMNYVNEGQDFDVVIDYAHSPDSFEKIFKDIKPLVKNQLIVVFGSAGRRDEAKRAIQGELAGKYADQVILTEEDDRDVDGRSILEDIAKGAIKAGKTKNKDLFLILDRPEAIHFATQRAKPGDMVMFLGKGHEKTIERANGENPWDEAKEVRQALKTIKKS
jgi:UDP-N-acetylmuramoyl-L-alanyl-D-glutamate--2,6-diaminopimelate ligase